MKHNSENNPGQFLYQYLAALSGSSSVIISGINLGWTSPYLPRILNGTESNITMTNDEGSWCAVMPLVGAPLGALYAAMVVDVIGRKNTILSMAPIAFLMFILLAFAKTTFLICFSRFIIGSIEGCLYTALPMYLGEISSPAIRGILTASISISTILGTLFINILGFYYSIFISSLICSVIPVIHFISFMWMPESPYYFLKKGKSDEAQRSLEILRSSKNVASELESLHEAVAKQESIEKPKLTDLFSVKSNRRAVIIFVILNLTKKFSGKNPLLFYTSTIFQTAGGDLDSNSSVMVFISVEAIVTTFALFFVDRYGRRPIIIYSTIGCVVTLALMGCYFFLKDLNEVYIADFGWLPVTILVLYNAFYSIGLELAPTVYLGELFPTNIKAIALGLADTFSIINGTIASKLFQILMDSQGIYLPFWIYSGCCFIGVVFIIRCVPETKNKTLEEIQNGLISKTSACTTE